MADAGRLKGQLSADKAAYLIHHTVLAAVHDRILAPSHDIGVTSDDLWVFCCTGVGADAAVKTKALTIAVISSDSGLRGRRLGAPLRVPPAGALRIRSGDRCHQESSRAPPPAS